MMKPNEAFTTVEDMFSNHRSKLLGFCLRLVGSKEVAEELVQDVFLKACSEEMTQFSKSWLYSCARRRCIDYLRRRSVWDRVKTRLWNTGNSNVVEEQILERSLGMSVLRKLPEKMRMALLLRSYVGLGYGCLLYTSPSPRDRTRSRMPSSA